MVDSREEEVNRAVGEKSVDGNEEPPHPISLTIFVVTDPETPTPDESTEPMVDDHRPEKPQSEKKPDPETTYIDPEAAEEIAATDETLSSGTGDGETSDEENTVAMPGHDHDETVLDDGSSDGQENREDEPKKTLGSFAQYELIEEISRGGMGVIYRARQFKPKRVVAIKMMLSGPWASAEDVQRFHAETEAAANLDHPNIVPIYEVGEVDGRHFFSMRFIDGDNLSGQVVDGPVAPKKAVELLLPVCRAIAYAHERGVVHRDLKPANILIDKDGRPHVTDFGLAKHIEGDSGLTATGQILGTPSYMPPEQAAGRISEIGPRVDVYSLGALLYFLVTARPPFQAANAVETLKQVIDEDTVTPRKHNTTIPRDLEAICLKCLEKKPANRYDSAEELADDLQRFLNGEPVEARHISLGRRCGRWMRRHPGQAAVVGLAVILIFGSAGWAWSAWQAAQEKQKRIEIVTPQAREILKRNCWECHGEDPQQVERNLDVLDHDRLVGGDRRLVVPGDADRSRLLARIKDDTMPPEEEELRLPRVSQKELDILTEWIELGAPEFPSEEEQPDIEPVVAYSESAMHVKRIFIRHCYDCHSHTERKGGIKILHHRLLTDVRHVVVPGNAEESELFHLVVVTDEEKVMPPKPLDRLSAEDIEAIRLWINEGAPPFPKGE